MHFWIDKRSQQCGFSGRHRAGPLAGSLAAGAAGCGGGGLQAPQRRRRRRRKPMVTPVHRFAAVDCGVPAPAPQVAAAAAARSPRLSPRPSPRPSRLPQRGRHLHTCLVPYSNGAASGGGGGAGTGLRGGGPHAVELDSSVFLDLPLDEADAVHHRPPPPAPALPVVGRLKCGMWASFAVATVFVAGAKFYFDHQFLSQGTGLEVLVLCALVIVLLLAGCTVSLCRSKATRDLLAAAVASASDAAAASSSSHAPWPAVEVEEGGAGRTVAAMQGPAAPASPPAPLRSAAPPPPPPAPEPPPPPYHIAILLPASSAEEAPPPAYDKVVL